MKVRKLYVDQYGNRFYASTVRELRSQIGAGKSRVGIMYQDSKSRGTLRTGYVIGAHWLSEYTPNERAA